MGAPCKTAQAGTTVHMSSNCSGMLVLSVCLTVAACMLNT